MAKPVDPFSIVAFYGLLTAIGVIAFWAVVIRYGSIDDLKDSWFVRLCRKGRKRDASK